MLENEQLLIGLNLAICIFHDSSDFDLISSFSDLKIINA